MNHSLYLLKDRYSLCHIYHLAFILFVILNIAGCGGLLTTAEVEPTQTYLFGSIAPKEVYIGKGKIVIIVATPTAQAGFDTTGIAYVHKPYRLDFYSKNQWIDSPQRMLSPLLVTALENTGRFQAVLPASSSISGDLRLETEFLCLQHELLTQPSQFHITLRVQLLDIRHQQVQAIRTFDTLESASSEDPYGGVVAANRAIIRLLEEIAKFVVTEAPNRSF
ncbi:cholesterol transport system auxiliary component [Gammaproteobacteria bacterium]